VLVVVVVMVVAVVAVVVVMMDQFLIHELSCLCLLK
jgi:hypothetical protein